MECNMSNIFHKMWRRKIRMSLFLDQQSEASYSLLLLYAQVEDYQNIKTKVLTTCFYFIWSFFENQKEVWDLIFCRIFEQKYFSWYILIVWLPLLLDFVNYNCFLSSLCNVINFEIFLSLLIKPFSYMTKKVSTKI